ncbi:MAG: outer membrane beta-barrel family protein [Lachnospiraceae bacterium]|nr:outer membrane beta-barrel family protein [Lachnospiraceae bacterium]
MHLSAGLRREMWQIRTRSLGYGQTDADVEQFKKNDFALFPSASIGWSFLGSNELKLNYSRRIRRPFGPQLNTFENISDPSEVHLGNPLIMPEYSNSVELSYIKNCSNHMLYGNGYTQSISKWSGGRTLRLAVTYTFGKTHNHEHGRHNHIDTRGYGEEHHHH